MFDEERSVALDDELDEEPWSTYDSDDGSVGEEGPSVLVEVPGEEDDEGALEVRDEPTSEELEEIPSSNPRTIPCGCICSRLDRCRCSSTGRRRGCLRNAWQVRISRDFARACRKAAARSLVCSCSAG
jgi:hypothetical protein